MSTTIYPLTWGSLSGVTAIKTESYTYGDSNWKDKLTAYGNSQITYDEIGNPLTYRGYTLTWQNGRQLASMQLKQMRIEFTYDVDGLRTSKTIPNVGLEHKYYYVGNRLQYETLGGSSALWYFYDADGNPSGIRYKDNSGTVNDYYFVCNWRGDVIQIYNASGTLVGSYTYDAWGRVTENSTDKDTQNIAEINPIRYRGYYYDTETRLYYLKSRYYDPAVKRFLNVDGFVSTSIEDVAKNMFAYCLNNPTIFSDLSGSMPEWKKLGFRYENNSCDFQRFNRGLPPMKYQIWLDNGGTVEPDYVDSNIYNVKKTVKSVTYIPKEQVDNEYIRSSHDNNKIGVSLAVDVIVDVLSGFTKNPYLIASAAAYSAISFINGVAAQCELEQFYRARSQGEGVVIIEWDISGNRCVPTTVKEFKSWNGEGSVFE